MIRPLPEHGRFTAGTRRSCTRACLRCVYTVVARLNGRVRTVYTADHGPCTWFVYDPNTAVYTVMYPVHGRVHGRGPCTRACLRPVYTAVDSVYGPGSRPYMTRKRPCTRPCTAVYTFRYYSNPIIRSLEIDLFTFSVAVTFWVTT